MISKFGKLVFGVAAASVLAAGSAVAATTAPVKIGVLGDMSGPYSTDFSGPGAVAAVKLAVKDFGGKVLGRPIEVLSADDQNQPSVASAKARQWVQEDHVNMITDLTDSAVGLAVQDLAAQEGVITINTGAATTQLTGQDCTPYGIHYGYDTHSLAVGTATPLVEGGGKKWFFITVNYAFGHSLQKQATAVVKVHGGSVVGSVDHPLGTNDFSSYLLQAKDSGANIIALANAGTDTANALKQAAEFDMPTANEKITALLLLPPDVRAVGLKTTQGLLFTVGWYWDLNKASREWTKRYLANGGTTPDAIHAALYSATMAYLNAVKSAGTTDTAAVRKAIGNHPINDFFAHGGEIQANGVLSHPMYLLKVKSPAQSKSQFDVATVVKTIPGNVAFQSAAASGCKLTTAQK